MPDLQPLPTRQRRDASDLLALFKEFRVAAEAKAVRFKPSPMCGSGAEAVPRLLEPIVRADGHGAGESDAATFDRSAKLSPTVGSGSEAGPGLLESEAIVPAACHGADESDTATFNPSAKRKRHYWKDSNGKRHRTNEHAVLQTPREKGLKCVHRRSRMTLENVHGGVVKATADLASIVATSTRTRLRVLGSTPFARRSSSVLPSRCVDERWSRWLGGGMCEA